MKMEKTPWNGSNHLRHPCYSLGDTALACIRQHPILYGVFLFLLLYIMVGPCGRPDGFRADRLYLPVLQIQWRMCTAHFLL